MDSDKYGNESNETYSYNTYNIFAYIIGILFSPVLGVIMGIVGVTQRKKNAWSIIIISILSWVLNLFVINNFL
ncbi:hypothetical protein AMS59_02765 [Lysinibacillus sp. FJAT-14745]|uniref:hypothetical protein n=1 Tax=Lysinibacillus sp. FJAT-14745 TaxID=1704289 RepID=UPI0006ABCD77|nr:hypothetical protein [Lysinibacillus sp. FJAT-14745]KOP80333.1 hypothetical protein AMS59_02765 [Lysinibacillus sp. FJAT-14745]